jgi:hypothetical protein
MEVRPPGDDGSFGTLTLGCERLSAAMLLAAQVPRGTGAVSVSTESAPFFQGSHFLT